MVFLRTIFAKESRRFTPTIMGSASTSFHGTNYSGGETSSPLGAAPQLEVEVTQNFENLDGHRGRTTALNTGISINAPLYLENQFYLTDKLSMLLGMQAIYAQRHFEDNFLSDDRGRPVPQTEFLRIQSEGRFDLRTRQNESVFREFQRELAATFVRQHGGIRRRKKLQRRLPTAAPPASLDPGARHSRRAGAF